MGIILKEIYELLSAIKGLIYMGIIYTMLDKERDLDLCIYSALMFILVFLIQFS